MLSDTDRKIGFVLGLLDYETVKDLEETITLKEPLPRIPKVGEMIMVINETALGSGCFESGKFITE